MFMEQLKIKDEEYVKSLKKQNDDVDDLIKTMKQQFGDMRLDYTNQLDNIEKAFHEERMAILKRNDDEIKHLFEEHRKLEDQFLKMRAEEDEKYSKSLEDLRTKDANDQATLKIELEKEMQILEKCMEDMKAVYRLNEEKLDFNHRVLNDRKDVMQKQVDSYKIKERKMKEKLGTIIEKFKEQSTDNQKKNIDLTIQYKKFTKLYKEL
jgi:dynein regulatory complex protein 1